MTVGRNETGRYLASMLTHMRGLLDQHFFYDDQSTDGTFAVANVLGCITWRRTDDVPSFVENEGAFRGGAWKAIEQWMRPEDGDWILVIDCDEVLVCTLAYEWKSCLHALCSMADKWAVGIDLNIPEVFGFDDDGCPLVRRDLLWGTIHAPRLFRYRPGGTYPPYGFGSPAVPSYVMGGHWENTDQIQIMHYGYAREEDQLTKYERYSGQSGHSSAHVESIVANNRSLERWKTGYVEEMSPSSSRLLET